MNETEKRILAQQALPECAIPQCTRKTQGGNSRFCTLHTVNVELVESVKACLFLLNEGQAILQNKKLGRVK